MKRKSKKTLLAERKRIQEAFKNQTYYAAWSDYKARLFVSMFDDDFDTDFLSMTDEQIINFAEQFMGEQ